ncbi:MAG: hypothetical protein CMJ84_16540 [Planctomycetes bacterium]|jgi:iron complex outermembrane receptor protein|nr:hypothetical protein [Planctomycetota bacterium]MDP6409948.1 TonB-dependent receptor [Planctomycetota bacterium]
MFTRDPIFLAAAVLCALTAPSALAWDAGPPLEGAQAQEPEVEPAPEPEPEVAQEPESEPAPEPEPVEEPEGEPQPEPAPAAEEEPAPEPAAAADGAIDLGEVIVTARKWEESLAGMTQSVTNLSGVELDEAGVRSVRDASALVPNLLVPEFTARRLSFPFVRGVGSGQGEPAVTTVIDGVPQLATGGANLPLVGVERLEFQRGPQPMIGRNSLGGVIRLVTAPPAGEPSSSHELTAGEHGLLEYRVGYSGPVTGEGFGFGFEGLRSVRDGFSRNALTGNLVDSRDLYFGRAQIVAAPTDDSELRVTLHAERSRDGGFALSDLGGLRADPHSIIQDFEGEVHRDIVAPAATWTNRGDTLDFTSITAFQRYDLLETSDLDFTPLDLVRRSTTESMDHFNQELRLSSSEAAPVEVAEDATLAWMAGVHLFVADAERDSANTFGADSDPGIGLPPSGTIGADSGHFEDVGMGVFVQATLTLHERLALSAGLRYDREEREADLSSSMELGGVPIIPGVDESLSEDFEQLSPHVGASYALDGGVHLYASLAEGFKPGGFNLTSPSGPGAFDPETSRSIEVGMRRSWERASVQLAFFDIAWDDLQISLFDPATGAGFVDNAGAANSRGMEIELDLEVCEGFSLVSGLGLVETELEEYVDSFGQDDAGNSLPFAPDQTSHLGARLHGELAGDARWFANAELVGVGDYFYDAGNLESESYQLLNLRAGIECGDWRVTLWARNALDEDYVPIAFQSSPFDPSQFVGESGAPQQVGVSVRVSF